MLTDRDAEILRHIIKYCHEINHTINVFGKDYTIFAQNSIYQNAVALCVLQIGELTTHLTADFKSTYTIVNDVSRFTLRRTQGCEAAIPNASVCILYSE